MATIINRENKKITFVGAGQPQIVIDFDKIVKLTIEDDAVAGQKVGRIYYSKDDGGESFVSILSAEKSLDSKLKSLAQMVKETTGHDVKIGPVVLG